MASSSRTLSAAGRTRAPRPTHYEPPKRGVHRYLITSAQNNTGAFDAGWASLQTLADHLDAWVLVAPYTYDKKGYIKQHTGMVNPHSIKPSDMGSEIWWDPTFEKYLVWEPVRLAHALTFCAGFDILPTAERPLRGLELHTGRRSAIYPHSKFELASVASGKFEGTKLLYTTGTMTKRNYIQRRTGQKAERHHCYGALLVEVTPDGAFYCRQVQATEQGVMHDLDVRVSGSEVSTSNPVEAVTWGDIHAAKLDEDVAKLFWGEGGLLDELQPRHQFFHDTLDFHSRNPHERRNPHRRYERYVEKRESVWSEAEHAARFLNYSLRDWCRSVVVKSNHDDWFERWLQDPSAFTEYDSQNVYTWLRGNLAWHDRVLREGSAGQFLPVEWLLREAGAPDEVRFLHEDESYVICKDEEGGIECGLHGHRGVNGRRGDMTALSTKMGRRGNFGDKHTAAIIDGGYWAGVTGKLDMGYNMGPSSWTRSLVVTYPTGMRTVMTVWNGRAKA